MYKKNILNIILITVFLVSIFLGFCLQSMAADKNITIGISIGNLRLERWKRDLDYMTDKATKLGAKVYSNSADGDERLQITQIENMLTRGIDVLIVIAVNSKVLSPAVEAAHKDNVKVIAYDRIIEDSDLDYYITFDMLGVGKLQAQYLLNLVPKGRYFLLAGPKEDNNARLFREGQMIILKPKIDNGDIKIVGDQWAEGWLSENAMRLTEDVLTVNNNEIDAILASNDSTASGAIQALIEQGLAGKIPVTGQDCDLAACKRIVDGTQTMSVYKPLPILAQGAVQLAFDIVTKAKIETNAIYNNGTKDVPSINLPIIAADKTNLIDTVIADGFHSYEDVYKDIPESQRPPKK